MASSRSFIAVPPGATIKEQLQQRKMSQKEFAMRLDTSEKHVSRLINGEVILTPEMALKLEMVLGVPARFWNNLESSYREKLVKVQEENDRDEDKDILKLFPYAEMVKLGWIEAASKDEDKIFNLRKYFEVVKLSLLEKNIVLNGLACRRLNSNEKADYSLLTFAQKAKIEARNRDIESINIRLLEYRISQIRKMTVLNPEVFSDKLIHILSECGIALIFLPHLSGSYLHGATFLDRNKIVIALTLRGKMADIFWFSLFHELGHVILGHIYEPHGLDESEEKEAGKYARDILIPEKYYKAFIDKRDFTKNSIISFSESISIDPGIVVGRLQKENYIKFSQFNDLKKKYELRN